MKKLFQSTIAWLRRRVTALRTVNEGAAGAVNSNQRLLVNVAEPRLRRRGRRLTVNDEGLTVNDEPKDELSYPLPLRVLPLSQRESAKTSHSETDPLLLRIEEFIDEHYRVRYNVLSGQYEVTERGVQRWKVLSGTLCNRILMELNRAGIVLAKPYIVKTVIEGGAMATPYHPVRNYLESLPAWDGAGHIEALFRRVTDDEQLLRWLRKWFIAMVAQVMGRMGTYGNSVCPILISSVQGWGKSQFAKLLVPPEVGGFFTDTFNLQQEDGCLRRMTCLLYTSPSPRD